MKMEIKDIWMGGFHVARNCAKGDYDDESLYQKWLKEAQPSPNNRYAAALEVLNEFRRDVPGGGETELFIYIQKRLTEKPGSHS